jgi:hypothetical protein
MRQDISSGLWPIFFKYSRIIFSEEATPLSIRKIVRV